MTYQARILERFSGGADPTPLYLPDLTLWYDWHHSRGTLPDQWPGDTLPEVARAMGVPLWLPIRPWRTRSANVAIQQTKKSGERIVRSETTLGTLVARWTCGPDGDWWQVEYPVKSAGDLPAALELVQARTYVLEPDALSRALTEVGNEGIVALELPRRPLSDLLHEFVGWSEGLILLGEPAIQDILSILEEKLQELVQEVSRLPGQIVFSPDNLDGQFISPRMFRKSLASSYRLTADVLHAAGKRLVVHLGGPVRHLLTSLAEAGVDGFEGLAGPPQSDASLAEARGIVGPICTLWGGIPQDYLLNTYDGEVFEAGVRQATRECQGDGRMILGVADRVPVDADPARLAAIPLLIQS